MTDEARKRAANRILEIRGEMLDLVREARRLARTHIESNSEYAHLDRYVLEQLAEFCEARSPYNKDLGNVASAIAAEARETMEEARQEDGR